MEPLDNYCNNDDDNNFLRYLAKLTYNLVKFRKEIQSVLDCHSVRIVLYFRKRCYKRVMSLNYDQIDIDRNFANVRNPYLTYQGYQNPYTYASGYAGAGSYMHPYVQYGSDRKFGFKHKFEHSSHGDDDSKKKSKKKTAALSALTLLAFLFFLNLLQSCLKDHLTAINPTVRPDLSKSHINFLYG